MRIRIIAVTGALAVGLFTGCSSSDDSGSDDRSTTTTTSAPAATLTILVTNDDGYESEGIDAVVEALRKIPDTEITVSAPAENRSGSGSSTSPDGVTATDQETRSGYDATAVNGFPADALAYGLDELLDEKPDLVVSGINDAPNLGPVTTVSGTVGAAKVAAAQGIPAIAASQGISDNTDFTTAAQYVVDWVTAHRSELVAGTAAADVVNLNVPICPSGQVRGVRQVPLATAGNANPAVDCASTASDVGDDIAAFAAGFASVTQVDVEGQTVTTSTTWPKSG